eukprot:NODE_356_length_8904_cov_1.034412.p3 type:complete len:422 gc:universal NODE_356_length_8904_cov_1.034412:4883-6148(+)
MSSLLYPSQIKSHPVASRKVKVHESGAIACLSNTLVVLKAPRPISFQKTVKSIAWHPKQLSIYAGNEMGEVTLWNPTHWKENPQKYKPHSSTILSLDVSLNYDVASGSSDKSIKIYNCDMRYVTTLNGHNNWVRELQWRDPFTLVSASDDHTIKIWDVRSKNHSTISFKGHCTDLQLHPIDQVVGLTHSSNASIFDFRTLEMIQLYPLGYQPRGLSFNSSYMTVAGPFSYEVFNVQSGEIKFHVDVDEQIFDVEWKFNKAYFAMDKSMQEWNIPLEDYLDLNISPLNLNAEEKATTPINPQLLRPKSQLSSIKQQHPQKPKSIKSHAVKQNKMQAEKIGFKTNSKIKPAAKHKSKDSVRNAEPPPAEKTEPNKAEYILLERSVESLTSQVEMLTRTVDVLLDRLQVVEGRIIEADEQVDDE